MAASDLATLRFELLQEQHLAEVAAIEQAANGSPWSERGFRNEIDHEHSIFLVAILSGRVVGFGGAWLVIDEAHIVNVAVVEPLRRSGIGEQLIVRVLQAAQKRGMTSSSLEVRKSNVAAIHLYEKLGFTVTNTRRGYYPDNREDALVMWLFDLDSWRVPAKTAVASAGE